MYFMDSRHPPGTVIVLSNELTRYADFSISLMRLQAPEGTTLYWAKGVEIAMGLNMALRSMTGEWVFILGDDHTFKPPVLMELLEEDVDIVAPICAKRSYPFMPVVFPKEEADGSFVQCPWSAIPKNQRFKVAGIGSAGMLIRKRVLDSIGDPWFKVGKINEQTLSEDLAFCREARSLGYTVWANSKVGIGHITPATIWPGEMDGETAPMLNLNGDEKRWLPMTKFYTTQAEENWNMKLV